MNGGEGGRGANALSRDGGNDLMRAHGVGAVDTIDGGDGEADVAIVDLSDGCETVVDVSEA